jgi:hypothetical protein
MEKRMRTKPRFDLEEVKKIFEELIGNKITNGIETTTKIVTRWRRGELKRIEVNNEDIGVTNRHQYETKLNRALLMSGRFRPNFTGRLEFEVTITGGKCRKIHYSISNFIF